MTKTALRVHISTHLWLRTARKKEKEKRKKGNRKREIPLSGTVCEPSILITRVFERKKGENKKGKREKRKEGNRKRELLASDMHAH